MLERQLEIVNKLGLHARAAAKLVSTAASFSSKITLNFAGQDADAKSIMAIMMLAAAQGSQITLRCEGRDEAAAMEALQSLIEDYFGEDE